MSVPESALNLLTHKASQAIWDLARKVWTITRDGADSIWIGRGWSDDSSEHNTGRAVDLIVSAKVGKMPTAAEKAAGERLVAWLVANAKTLHIRHILWDKRIYRTRYAGWGALPGRDSSSSISDWHQDHIHVLLEDTSGSIPTGGLGAASTPSKPASKPSTPTAAGKKSTYLSKLRFGQRDSDSVRNLQRALNAHKMKGGSNLPITGNYLSQTDAEVRLCQRLHGYGNDKAGASFVGPKQAKHLGLPDVRS